MTVSLVAQVSEELVEAVRRLMPQLTDRAAPSSDDLVRVIESETTSLWIARSDDGLIIGMLTLAVYHTPTGIHAWIEDVVVDRQARGAGFGAALTNAAVDHARSRGAKAVNLTSRPARAAANRLYQKLGFQEIDTNLYRFYLE